MSHSLSRQEVEELLAAARRGNLDSVKKICESSKRANVNLIKGANGWTPLHYASMHGRLDIVKYLLEKQKAPINCGDDHKRTPLHLACSWGRLEVVRYLTGRPGIKIRSKALSGMIPLQFVDCRKNAEVANYMRAIMDESEDAEGQDDREKNTMVGDHLEPIVDETEDNEEHDHNSLGCQTALTEPITVGSDIQTEEQEAQPLPDPDRAWIPKLPKPQVLLDIAAMIGTNLPARQRPIADPEPSVPPETNPNARERPPVRVHHVESLISMPIPTSEDELTKHVSNLIAVEKPCVKWLAGLAQRELKSGYKLDLTDIMWCKRLARLYHKVVPALKKLRSYSTPAEDEETKPKVFISHTGVDKDPYAAPLAKHLAENNVSVFLDRISLEPGADAVEKMLFEAVHCKYMWCVVSKEYVQQWWPMRELMIGYARHLQEKKSAFCLIMDCFEKDYKRGLWLDQILGEMQSLTLYDGRGKKRPFPTMLRSVMDEDHCARYQRIASTRLADGSTLVEGKSVVSFLDTIFGWRLYLLAFLAWLSLAGVLPLFVIRLLRLPSVDAIA